MLKDLGAKLSRLIARICRSGGELSGFELKMGRFVRTPNVFFSEMMEKDFQHLSIACGAGKSQFLEWPQTSDLRFRRRMPDELSSRGLDGELGDI